MGHVALRDFRTLVKHGPHSLRDIRICKVLVMDHLGDNIPVPTMFCSSWRVGIFPSLLRICRVTHLFMLEFSRGDH